MRYIKNEGEGRKQILPFLALFVQNRVVAQKVALSWVVCRGCQPSCGELEALCANAHVMSLNGQPF